MKFFICLAILIATAVANPATPSLSNASQNVKVQEANEADAQPAAVVGDLTRLRKSAYGGSSGSHGGSSIPAPPCPKNYIISCQPSLAPVACSAPSSAYGSQGAYSAPVPTYLAPLPYGGYGIPQPIAYNNQYYTY